MDILQQAILDVNRIKEVGMRAAQKKLMEKYSKDLKKLYIKEAADALDDTDADLGSDEGDGLDLEGLDLGGGEGESPDSGGDLGADQSQAGAAQAPGTQANAGLPPQNEPNFVDNIPETDEDETVIELFVSEQEPDTVSDEGLDIESIKSATDQVEMGMSSAEPQPGLEGALEANPELNLEPDVLDDSDESMFDENIFDSINKDISISDDILYEYIEKSLNQDERFKKLEETVNSLNKMVDELTSQLEKSNTNLKTIREQNIRLVYKNQALIDDSLSEHQKKNIVEALDKAKTINEARAIYETLKKVSQNKKVSDKVDNRLSEKNITKKFLTESRKNVAKEEKTEKLPEIAQKLFQSWGIDK